MTTCLRSVSTAKVRLQQGQGVSCVDCSGTYSGTGIEDPEVSGGGAGKSSSAPRLESSVSGSVVLLVAVDASKKWIG